MMVISEEEIEIEWPAHWSEWSRQLLDEMKEFETAHKDFLPACVPDWVCSMGVELGKVMLPALTYDLEGISGAEFLGRIVGQTERLLDFDLMQKRFEWLLEVGEKIDKQLRKDRTTQEYLKVRKSLRPHRKTGGKMLRKMWFTIARKTELIENAITQARSAPEDEMVDFFYGYSKGLKKSTFTQDGKLRNETTASPIYFQMVFHWQQVRQFPNLTVLHTWLCQREKPNVVGSIYRLKKICERHGVRLARRGRPRKK